MASKRLATRSSPQPPKLDLGFVNKNLNTGPFGKPQGQSVKSPRSRPPAPWRSIGEIVAKTIDRIGRERAL